MLYSHEQGTLGDLDDIRLALPTPAPLVKRGPGKQTKKVVFPETPASIKLTHTHTHTFARLHLVSLG